MDREHNAIAAANTPVMSSLLRTCPHSKLEASGTPIGLMPKQMGGSEVGHLTIGGGRVVFQGVAQISAAINDGTFFSNKAFLGAIEDAKKNKSRLHVMGLLSDQGVHSMDDHVFALLELCKKQGFSDVWVHAFMDGRDSPPKSGKMYLTRLLERMKELGVGHLASMVGRFYAMDRDKRWDRVKRGYDLLVKGIGVESSDPVKTVEEFYLKDITDEFMEPIKVKGAPSIQSGDSVISFNFRPDRARELSFALTDPGFKEFDRGAFPNVHYVCMAPYHKDIKAAVAFYPREVPNSLGEVVSKHGLRQLRIAETEKYAHVTFFFSGGREDVFPGEERILIPSPKEVSTYDKKPEMSALVVRDMVIEQIRSGAFDLIVLNFANADMVGHTGVFDATVKAVETVDACVGLILDVVRKAGGQALIIADHGNADEKIDVNGNPITFHSLNPVPCILVSDRKCSLKDGTLVDVAPTILDLMGLPVPKDMTGKSLIQ